MGRQTRLLFGISVFWLALSVLFDGVNTLVLPPQFSTPETSEEGFQQVHLRLAAQHLHLSTVKQPTVKIKTVFTVFYLIID
jgi:hypothetical protein